MKRYTLVVCVSGDADTVHLLRDICDGSNKHRENLGSGVITEDHCTQFTEQGGERTRVKSSPYLTSCCWRAQKEVHLSIP